MEIAEIQLCKDAKVSVEELFSRSRPALLMSTSFLPLSSAEQVLAFRKGGFSNRNWAKFTSNPGEP